MAEMAVDDGHRIAEPSDLLPQTSSSFWKGALKVLKPLASLKLTVALLVMAIFIVFTGTLAQVQKDVWEAINHYFRTPIAWIDFQIFFPPSFFPSRPIVP